MRRIRKWILAPIALACVAGVYVCARRYGFEGASGAGRWFASHPFAAAMIAFGAICLLEFGLSRILRLGEPVIGVTIVTWIVEICLVVSFYTVFALTAFFSKATGKNRLPRHAPDATSYWLPREQTPMSMENFVKQ